MIEPELGRDGKQLPAAQSLGGGQKNLLFHPDMAEKPGSKLIIRSLVNLGRLSHGRLKQSIESPVVFY